MKIPSPRNARFALAYALAAMAACATASAADGTWTNLNTGNASGNWYTPGNWAGNTIASGEGFTADFSTLNITADSTVTLDAPVTIGNLTFGDTATGTSASWTLSNGGLPANTLTLDGTTPTITVNSLGTVGQVNINANILGTDGLVKTGLGRLVLNGTNTYTGALTDSNFGARTFGTIINRGRVVLGTATAAGTGDILVTQGAGTAFLDLNGQTISNNIALRNDSYLMNTNLGSSAIINGDITVSNYARIGSSPADALGTITINGDISFANSGHQLFLSPYGGITELNGTNGQGTYIINGGTVRAVDGVGIHTAARLRIDGGVLETSANFTRSLGVGSTLVEMGNMSAAGSGFSARGGNVIVALGGLATPSSLTWGANSFMAASSTLVLNSATADSQLTFTNAVDLNGATRTIAVNASTAVISGNLTNSNGTAGLTKTGDGTLSLTGTNTYNGVTTISGGTMRGNVASLPGNIVNNAALAFDQGTDATFSPSISGSGTLEKAGAGTLTLGANSYTGSTLVSAGTLRLGSATSVGTGTAGVTVNSGAALDLNGNSIASTNKIVTISGNGSGTGALVNTSGTSAGIRQLNLGGNATVGGTGRIDVGFGATAISGGTNTLTKTGTGLLVINSGATTMGEFDIQEGTVSVVNTATGLGDTNHGTTIRSGGTLSFFNSTGAAISNSEAFSIADGGTLYSSTSVNANVLNGGVNLTGGTANVFVFKSGTVSHANRMQLNGAITGTGGLRKTGEGTLELTGASNYQGDTAHAEGTLLINNVSGSATGLGDLTVSSGATLAGAGTIGGSATVSGIIAPGNSIGTLTIGNDLTWNGTAANAWQFELGAGNTADLLSVGGNFNRGTGTDFVFNFLGSTQAGTFTVVDWAGTTDFLAGDFTYTNLGGGNTGAFSFSGNSLQFTVVPEPSAGLVLALSLGAVAVHRRSRHRAA